MKLRELLTRPPQRAWTLDVVEGRHLLVPVLMQVPEHLELVRHAGGHRGVAALGIIERSEQVVAGNEGHVMCNLRRPQQWTVALVVGGPKADEFGDIDLPCLT